MLDIGLICQPDQTARIRISKHTEKHHQKNPIRGQLSQKKQQQAACVSD